MAERSTLCVFCGSRMGSDIRFSEQSEKLGQCIGKRGMQLVFGGGDIGLMSIVARAVVRAGGNVTGVIPEFLHAFEVGFVEGSHEIQVASMHERKAKMFALSDAFVVMPGGLGTLDESIEIITWKQLQQHNKPIVFVNINGYWNPFLNLIDHIVEHNFGHDKVKELYQVVDNVDQVFTAIESAPDVDEQVLLSHL